MQSLIFLFALLMILSTVTGFFMLPQWVYYGVLGATAFLCLITPGTRRWGQPLIMLFLAICALSILFNQPPSYFNAWVRLLGFLIVLIAVGPIFVSKRVGEIRIILFDSLMKICVVLSVGSFICYFMGINFFIRNDEVLEIEAGHFSGLYSHSMLLGPLSGLSSLYVFSKYLGTEKGKVWKLVILFACLGASLLSASRAAFGACVVGMIILFMRFFRGRLSKALTIGLVIAALLAASFPIWGSLTELMSDKQTARMAEGLGINSREGMFIVRWKEFSSHTITGVGFCCVDPSLSYVDMSKGKVEPGTSWLAVLSMTGLFGFITFILLFIKTISYAFKNPSLQISSLYLGLLGFFFFHLLFEGYIFAMGSIMSLLFWLIMGNICYLNIYKY